jgi:hypothetical protein
MSDLSEHGFRLTKTRENIKAKVFRQFPATDKLDFNNCLAAVNQIADTAAF